MKNNKIIKSFLVVFIFLILCELNAAPRGGGGRGGASGLVNTGGRTIQRSPSLSRSGGSTNINRGQSSGANTRPTTANPRIGGQTSTRSDVQQFIKNNPVQARSNENAGNIRQQIQSPNNSNVIGSHVRNNVNINYPNRNYWFNNNFFDSHHYRPAYYNARANWWAAATAAGVGSWLGYQTAPYYYGYDNGTFGVTEYPLSETNAIQPSFDAANGTDGNWMSLGVFSISKNSESLATPNLFIQLALDKGGMISGTLFNAQTNESHELEGSVDSTSQRALWKVASSQGGPVIETGIYNLTQDEVPIQIHFANGQVQQGLLVRVDK